MNMSEEEKIDEVEPKNDPFWLVCLRCAWERDYSPEKEEVCLIAQKECPLSKYNIIKSQKKF